MSMQRDPEQTEVHHLQSYADLQGAQILEIGCGDGRLTWRYAQQVAQVMAIDPDPLRLAIALEARPLVLGNIATFICSRAENLPFSNATFDGAVLAWSL